MRAFYVVVVLVLVGTFSYCENLTSGKGERMSLLNSMKMDEHRKLNSSENGEPYAR